jgi:hypothetical protein
VGWFRYRIGEDLQTAAELGGTAALRTAGKTDLFREEVDETGAIVGDSRLVIAEYAVDLQFYDFGFDVALGTAPLELVVDPLVSDVADAGGTGKLGLPWASDAAVSEQLRFLTVKLSVRTPDEDETVAFDARTGAFAPLRTYEVFPALEGAARVEALARRVDLENHWFHKRM